MCGRARPQTSLRDGVGVSGHSDPSRLGCIERASPGRRTGIFAHSSSGLIPGAADRHAGSPSRVEPGPAGLLQDAMGVFSTGRRRAP